MNEFDQFMKHDLKVKNYARYTDDFVVISEDIVYLRNLIKPINQFLNQKLRLNLHPNKTTIRKYKQGVDFLGYVILPHHTLIRKRTWKRMLRKYKERIKEYEQGKISKESLNQSLQSYLGNLSHANAYKLSELLKNQVWLDSKIL